jgi:uncharacterized membrane protein
MGTLMFGALGAVVSMGLGWTLVWFSGYEGSAVLTWHQVLGTATAVSAVLSAVVCWRTGAERRSWWRTGLILVTAALVGVTGHLGGTLVHGNLLSP